MDKREKTLSQKKQELTLGGFQLTSQGGPLKLGLMVAGHHLVVQDGASLFDLLKKKAI
jgi:hypothetical protein